MLPLRLIRPQIDLSPDLVEQVRTLLLDAMCDGTLVPGTRLRQEELAEWFDVSRQPVLQALHLLKRDGFVTDSGRRGLMVAPLDSAMIVRIYEVRSVLDGLAARLAAGHACEIDCNLIYDGRKAASGKSLHRMIDADMAFHHALYDASGNDFIAESAESHWMHIRRAMGAVLQETGTRSTVWDEHEAILDAVQRGQVARAERLARAHGAEAGGKLAARLDKLAKLAKSA